MFNSQSGGCVGTGNPLPKFDSVRNSRTLTSDRGFANPSTPAAAVSHTRFENMNHKVAE